MKQNNLTLACGCDREKIASQRSYFHSNRRIYHCCQCQNPQLGEKLKELEGKLICNGCYTTFHQQLDRDDPRSRHYYTQGEGSGTLVTCKVCKIEEPRNRMQYIDSITQDL